MKKKTTCLIRKSKNEVSIVECNLLPKRALVMYIEKKIAPIHKNRLRQFQLENGNYYISEDLLKVLARAFKVNYEDLWNEIYMNDCSFEANIVLD
jgi:hypothetical protein